MKVIVQGLATEYQDEGAGPVILFLHGWQDTVQSFDSLVPLLFVTNRVIRLDLPGFGRTEFPKEVWDLDRFVGFVVGFIQKLDIVVDVIVGHSFGGRIVIKGVVTGHLQPRKIVLIGSAGLAKKRTIRNSVLKIIAKIGGVVTDIPPFVIWRESLRKKMYQSIGSDYLHAGALRETFLKIIAEDLGADAKKISIPTLLIWGSGDTETPLRDGKRLCQLIPNSKLSVINGAGHFVHKEKPQEVATLIRTFL